MAIWLWTEKFQILSQKLRQEISVTQPMESVPANLKAFLIHVEADHVKLYTFFHTFHVVLNQIWY